MRKQRVLFICTGNSARSQMAEAMLRQKAGQYFDAYSAGSEARGIHPMTMQVMEEAGYDLSAHSSKSLKQFIGQMFDHVVIVCRRAEANCPTVYPQAKRHRFLLNDPVRAEGSDEEKLQAFRDVRDRLNARLDLWIAETLELVGSESTA